MRQHHGATRYRALAPVAREAARPSVTVATSTAVTRQLLPSRPLPRPQLTAAVSAMDRDEVLARVAPLLRQALTAPAAPVDPAVVGLAKLVREAQFPYESPGHRWDA